MTDVVPSPEEITARVKALESMLIEKGLVTSQMIDRFVEIYEEEVGPQLGATIIARAWVDAEFKSRLLENATEACLELGIGGMDGAHMRALENTDEVHHAVVCTLCSCYPWPVMGLPPNWYKDPQYRSRMVREPRKVLAEEFKFPIPKEKEIRVWDSSSEIRYWVLPQRPEGSEGWTEQQLAQLVTRDSMIGVGPTKAVS